MSPPWSLVHLPSADIPSSRYHAIRKEWGLTVICLPAWTRHYKYIPWAQYYWSRGCFAGSRSEKEDSCVAQTIISGSPAFRSIEEWNTYEMEINGLLGSSLLISTSPAPGEGPLSEMSALTLLDLHGPLMYLSSDRSLRFQNRVLAT